jgi:predicted ribosome quality control (RQC) complex YloA/Tae2 family protein
MGEIITTHMTTLKRGQSQAKLPDPYAAAGGFVLISLDPRLSPAENAQRYFKRFRKAKAGLPKIQERLEQVRRRTEKLEEIRARLHQAGDDDQLIKIRKALDRLGITITAPPISKQTRKAAVQKKPLSFTLGQNWIVWVGRNNKENDHLTHHLAKAGDLWFHAQGVPGSHVILRREGRKDEPHKELLEEVACIAAHFSRARHSQTVPVVYTEKRYVRKPRGAAPGLVVIEREKTLFVKPWLPEKVERKNQ